MVFIINILLLKMTLTWFCDVYTCILRMLCIKEQKLLTLKLF